MPEPARSSQHLRVGIFIDFVYHSAGGALSADQAVVRFVTELAPRVGEIVLFGRRRESATHAPYEIPAGGVRLIALPDYQSVAHVGELARSAQRACRTFASSLDEIDVVWLFGPHPLSIAFALIARRRGIPVMLGVRQDFPRYIGGRVSRANRSWAVPIAAAHEAAFRTLARRMPTVAVGDDLARRYGADRRPHVRSIGISLIRAADIVERDTALSRRWDDDELRVLSVGRLDPEKNPLLLADTLGSLLERDKRWRLDVVGDGPMGQALAERGGALGLGERLRLHGYVANGPDLITMYRKANVFLHVSFTEGLPQVLFEAAAAGLPIVATNVGGVGAALSGGDAGLLIPPGDADAAAHALERLRDDGALRASAIEHVLAVARRGTIEHAHDQLLDLLESQLPVGGRGAS